MEVGTRKITIVTVTYNCVETIERTIESVVSQQNASFEYIVIDGASTDGTTNIIDCYREKIDYYVSEPDNGIYDAMNKALKQASGDMILFLNGDDYFISSNVLENISKWIIDDDTIVIGRVKYGDKLSECYSDHSFKSPYFNIFYPHQATFIPGKLYKKLGGFDEKSKISADFEWICRAIYNGVKIKWVDELISVYRLGGRSASLQCKIDEYNISRKYMELTQDPYIEEMENETYEKVKNYFFKSMCLEEDRIQKLTPATEELFGSDQVIQIWGAGMWGQILAKLLLDCGISVNYIFDSSKKCEYIEGIKVCEFDRGKATRIIVASELYDEEITIMLKGMGYISDKDFISFSKLRDIFLEYFDVNNAEYKDFVHQTGLELLG